MESGSAATVRPPPTPKPARAAASTENRLPVTSTDNHCAPPAQPGDMPGLRPTPSGQRLRPRRAAVSQLPASHDDDLRDLQPLGSCRGLQAHQATMLHACQQRRGCCVGCARVKLVRGGSLTDPLCGSCIVPNAPGMLGPAAANTPSCARAAAAAARCASGYTSCSARPPARFIPSCRPCMTTWRTTNARTPCSPG